SPEHELTYCARFMLVLVGLLAGLRNGECSGLQWDCIDLEGRMIYIRRAWRKGEGIIPETKTGKSGYRDIPMSPILSTPIVNGCNRSDTKLRGKSPYSSPKRRRSSVRWRYHRATGQRLPPKLDLWTRTVASITHSIRSVIP